MYEAFCARDWSKPFFLRPSLLLSTIAVTHSIKAFQVFKLELSNTGKTYKSIP